MMRNENVLLECKNVDFGYENYDAVKGVNLQIEKGDYLCIVGENGSGKSTLIKGILGLLKPTGGELWMAEELKNHGIGYLPQQTAAQKDFPATVQEVVLSGCLSHLGRWPFYGKKEKDIANLQMERLKIEDLRKKCYRELSGGQQQRVLIARALCAARGLFVLDEPITGLDPAATQELYALIRELNQKENMTIVMVSHDMQGIVTEAGKVLHLKQSPLFCGTTKEYRQSAVGQQFLGRIAGGRGE